MNSLQEFKHHMNWTLIEITEKEVEALYNSVNSERYKTPEELEEDYDVDTNIIIYDVNLHSVLENYRYFIETGRSRFLSLFYLSDADMYAGVYGYDY